MILAKLGLDSVGMVEATDATPSGASTLAGAAYMQEEGSTKAYPCITTAAVAAADGFIGGFRYTTAGALRVSDVTAGIPASNSINQGILMTDNGQVCYSSAAGGTVLNGLSLTDDGAVSMAVMAFLLEFADSGAGAVDTTATFGGVSATFTRATTATTVLSTGLIASVASGTARSYYDPTSLTYLGYLAEGERTNICLQSEDFNTTWVPSNCTIANVASPVAPDGTGTADSFTESTDVGATSHQDVQTITVLNTTAYTVSVWVRASARSQMSLTLSTGTTNASGLFDLSAGTVSSVTGSATITAYSNSWYRCTITGTTDGTTATLFIFSKVGGVDYQGDGSLCFHLWGAQLEAADFASSYIPTTTAAVTRNADVLTYPTTGWLSATAGTLYARFQTSTLAAVTKGVFTIGDGTNNEYIAIRADTALSHFVIVDGGVVQANIQFGSQSANTTRDFSGAYAANDAQAANDGTLGTADTGLTLPTVSIVHIGAADDGTGELYGPIRRAAYYNARLPNAKLQRLTT